MKILIFLLLILNLLSCGKKIQDEISEQTKARKLMNESRYEEALIAYEKLHEESPDNENIRFELATSYAARAGIDIYSLYPLLEKAVFSTTLLKTGDSSSKSSKKSNQNALEKREVKAIEESKNHDQSVVGLDQDTISKEVYILNLSKMILKTMYAIGESFTNLALIPQLDEHEKKYLWLSIDTLNYKFKKQKIKSQARDYSFILHLVLIANEIKDIFYINEQLDIIDNICEKSPVEIDESLDRIDRITSSLMEEVPSNEKLKKLQYKIHELFDPVLTLKNKNPDLLKKISEVKNSICL